MDQEAFPNRTKPQQSGESGITYLAHFFTNSLGWIFHRVPQENDYGIDARVEIVQDGSVTGRILAIQVKHGDSYFRSSNELGYKYEGSIRHLNYYLNSQVPVILIILDSSFDKKNWIVFDLEKTSPTENGWWIEIPKKQKLTPEVAESWKEIAGQPIDFQDLVRQQWRIDKYFEEASRYLIAIPQEEVEHSIYETPVRLFAKFTKNQPLLFQARSAVDIFFPDYDHDPREIWDIPEIMLWLYHSIEIGVPWFYFLRMTGPYASFKMFFYAYFHFHHIPRIDGRYYLDTESENFKNFLNAIFDNLNQFTIGLDLSIDINRQISMEIFSAIRNYFSIGES